MTDEGESQDYESKTISERITLLPEKVRRKGFTWLISRVKEEGSRLSIYLCHILFYVQRRLLGFLSLLVGPLRRMSKQTLVAVYDLDAFPPSFDVCWFLVWADIERETQGIEHLHTLIIPADEDLRTYNPGYDAIIDRNSRAWRFRNICVASTDLIPSNNGVTVAIDRTHALSQEISFACLYPRPLAPGREMPSLTRIRQETIAKLTEMRGRWTGMRATEQGLIYARQWIDAHCEGKKPIVISFRQYGYDADRNSNIKEWVAFARNLDASKYCPVFIPDTDASLSGQPECADFHVVHAAAWNLSLRMAFYELAYLNMLTTSGHLELCVLNPVSRYLFFKVVVPSSPLATEDHLNRLGFHKGETPAFASSFQKWVWEDDNLNVIEREFSQMARNIETSESVPTTAKEA